MTVALEWDAWSAAHPGRTLPPGKPGTHCTGAGWAPGPVWMDGKSRLDRDSIPDRPARSSVAIPTEPQLPSNAGISFGETLWVKTNCYFMRDLLLFA